MNYQRGQGMDSESPQPAEDRLKDEVEVETQNPQVDDKFELMLAEGLAEIERAYQDRLKSLYDKRDQACSEEAYRLYRHLQFEQLRPERRMTAGQREKMPETSRSGRRFNLGAPRDSKEKRAANRRFYAKWQAMQIGKPVPGVEY